MGAQSQPRFSFIRCLTLKAHEKGEEKQCVIGYHSHHEGLSSPEETHTSRNVNPHSPKIPSRYPPQADIERGRRENSCSEGRRKHRKGFPFANEKAVADKEPWLISTQSSLSMAVIFKRTSRKGEGAPDSKARWQELEGPPRHRGHDSGRKLFSQSPTRSPTHNHYAGNDHK